MSLRCRARNRKEIKVVNGRRRSDESMRIVCLSANARRNYWAMMLMNSIDDDMLVSLQHLLSIKIDWFRNIVGKERSDEHRHLITGTLDFFLCHLKLKRREKLEGNIRKMWLRNWRQQRGRLMWLEGEWWVRKSERVERVKRVLWIFIKAPNFCYNSDWLFIFLSWFKIKIKENIIQRFKS